VPAKNTLTAADAGHVEAGFRLKLAEFDDGRTADGLPKDVQSPPEAQPGLLNPEAEEASVAATEVVAHVAIALSEPDAGNPQMYAGEGGGGVGGGIDKSVLTIGEPRRIRDKAHRKFVSSQACLICGRQPSDPHHLRSAQPRALSRKVSDEFTVPLCRIHHREIHRGADEAAWWNRFGVDPYFVAATLWAQTRPVRSIAELPSHNPSTAPPAATLDPASASRLPDPRRPNGPRNRKTKPIIAAGAQ
jgi:hypothetical protein